MTHIVTLPDGRSCAVCNLCGPRHIGQPTQPLKCDFCDAPAAFGVALYDLDTKSTTFMQHDVKRCCETHYDVLCRKARSHHIQITGALGFRTSTFVGIRSRQDVERWKEANAR